VKCVDSSLSHLKKGLERQTKARVSKTSGRRAQET
jgi:hypothetical protein